MQSWEHVKAWLIKVTINCSRKHFAKFEIKNFLPVEEIEETGVEEGGYERAEGEGPVTEAVKKLPPKYRNVVHLFYYEELSVQEIAGATGQKESTVKSQLFRAREMLKEMLKGEIDL